MKCQLSPQAEADILEIGDTIARDNPQRAASFVRKLLAHSRKIAELPEAHPARDDLAEGLLSCVYQRYVIYFTVSTAAVRIERILHGSRDITSDNFLLDEIDPADPPPSVDHHPPRAA
jgi:plasmid stabilization system protein ParE